MTGVTLRDIRDDDIAIFYHQQMDPIANRMAAFTPSDAGDPDAFTARWHGMIANPAVEKRTILLGDDVAGSILGFTRDGKREVGYWVDRPLWGRGVGRAALEQFLAIEQARPLYARIAGDNIGSRTIAERCGFVAVSSERMHDATRGGEIEEVLYELR